MNPDRVLHCTLRSSHSYKVLIHTAATHTGEQLSGELEYLDGRGGIEGFQDFERGVLLNGVERTQIGILRHTVNEVLHTPTKITFDEAISLLL